MAMSIYSAGIETMHCRLFRDVQYRPGRRDIMPIVNENIYRDRFLTLGGEKPNANRYAEELFPRFYVC